MRELEAITAIRGREGQRHFKTRRSVGRGKWRNKVEVRREETTQLGSLQIQRDKVERHEGARLGRETERQSEEVERQ